jgi:uncharacterized membrane protein YbhN (UPF0104 family)
MSQEAKQMRIPMVSKLLYWAVLFAVLVALFQWVLDWDATLQAWSNLSFHQIATSIALLLASYLARSARLYAHLYTGIHVRFYQCIRIILQHNFFINFLPFRAGEATFPLLIKRQFGISLSQATGILVSFRGFDLLILLTLGLITILTGLQITDQSGTIVRVLLILFSTMCLLFLLLYNYGYSIPWVRKYWIHFKSGLPADTGEIFHLLFWTLLAWTTKLFAYASILSAFLQVSTPLSLLSALSGELASSIPIYTPAAFGTFESGVIGVLLPAGINLETALTAAINLHLFILSITLLVTGFGVLTGRHANDTR